MLVDPDNEERLVEASTWAKAVVTTFLKIHEQCSVPLTKEVLQHVVEEALVSGYLTGSAIEREGETQELALPDSEVIH